MIVHKFNLKEVTKGSKPEHERMQELLQMEAERKIACLEGAIAYFELWVKLAETPSVEATSST